MTEVSINHNGVPFYFPADVAKEGSSYVRIEDYLKVRVHDNGKVVPFKWYDQGRVMNVHGYIPFIQGLVGGYTTDDDNEVVMAPDASYRDWQGTTANAHDGGYMDYILEDQMFPQEGVFKGHFGLKDTSGNILTSVNIIFEVLGDDLRIGETTKYYSSQLDKMVNEFKVRTQQVIDDARNAYESETKNTHDSLDALKAQIQANRDEQENLAQHLVGTEQQIEVHDVVTRPEYEKLSNQIVTKLSQINTAPNYYINYADMINKNPHGTDNLCVTSDTQHKWLYINGSWEDLGNFSYADVGPNLKKAILLNNPDNVLPDSDFRTNDYWWVGSNSSSKLVLDNVIDRTKSKGNSYYFNLSGDLNDLTAARWLISNTISIPQSVRGNFISFGFRASVYNSQKIPDASVYAIMHFSNDKKTFPSAVYQLQNSDSERVYKFSYVRVPADATTISLGFTVQGRGRICGTRPEICLSPTLSPYSSSELVSNSLFALSPNQDNVLLNSDLKTTDFWTADSSDQSLNKMEDVIDQTKSKGQSHYFHLKGSPNAFKWIISDRRSIDGNKVVSCGFKATVTGTQGNVYGNLHGYDNVGNQVMNYPLPIYPAEADHYYKYYNLSIPDTTESICLGITVTNDGEIYGVQPELNFSKIPYSYSIGEVDQKLNTITEDSDLLYTDSNQIRNSNLKLSDANNEPLIVGSNDASLTKFAEILDSDDIYGNSNFFNLTGNLNNLKTCRWIITPNIPLKNASKVSWGFKAIIRINTDSQAYSTIRFLDQEGNQIAYEHRNFVNNDKLNYYKFENITVPAKAAFMNIGITVQGKAQIHGTQLQVSFKEFLLPYSIADIQFESALPQLRIYTTNNQSVGNDWTNARYTYTSRDKRQAGYVQLAVQGDSSRAYPKKNYKTKFFEDPDFKNKFSWKPKSDWTKNHKFNLKANWIDATQSRNLVNAEIFAKATAVSDFKNPSVAAKLANSQNFGQMEGFPIEIYVNNDYKGLYTFNTKKDEKVFNMSDKNKVEETLEFENGLAKDSTIDGSAISTIVNDNPTSELNTNFAKLRDFIFNSSDTDFRKHITDYIDLTSAMNVYLFGVLSQEWDYYTKSELWLTWNSGQYFYIIPYDLDSTWGLMWNGTKDDKSEAVFDLDVNKPGNFVAGVSHLLMRIYQLFKPELYKQYKFLRTTVWRNDQMINAFKHYIDAIPEEVYERDQAKWPDIPSKSITSFAQIQQAIIERGNAMDNFMEHLTDSQSTSPAPQPTTPQAQSTEPKQ